MSRIASIRLSDLLPLAWGSIRKNRLRSTLTIGAIAVGIAVMVYLLSLGLGLQRMTIGNVESSATLLTITVNSGSEQLLPLDSKAMAKIQGLKGVDKILPRLTIKGKLTLDDKNAPVTLVGVDPDYLQITNETQLSAGEYYRKDDQQTMVVTTGLLKLFGLDEKKVPLITFQMVLDPDAYPNIKPVSDVSITGVVDADSATAYLPRTYLEGLVGADNLPSYEHVKVVVRNLDDIEPVRNQLIANAFRVSTVVDTVQEIKNVFKWITGTMAVLGLIAVFVASIGMFNTLTISLLERTREIGIMKALGVRKGDIRRLFILEAMLMGITGGVMGLAIAFTLQELTLFSLSLLASIVNGTVPALFYNHWILITGAVAFAIFIATATGFYPARRAMGLNPIEAIKHE